MDFDYFVRQMFDPGQVLTHVPYALFVLSMMMKEMGWLRAIAIVASLVRIINRLFFSIDVIIAFWEVIFISVNICQLAILWYYARRHRFAEHEKLFVAAMPASVERRTVRRLLKLASPRTADPGATMTREGEPVSELMFITEGVVQIERGGEIVAVCGPGDFIGELSFVTGAPATATAVVVKPVRYLAFEQAQLRAAFKADGQLKRAMDAGFSRNLVGKLMKTGQGVPTGA